MHWLPDPHAPTDSAVPHFAPAGYVVMYPCKPQSNPRSHERMGQYALACKLAELKGFSFAGTFDPARHYNAPLYFVPNDTISPLEKARQIGIFGEQDLFGGVVPYPFVATKVITHPLLASGSAAPPGWAPVFAERVHDVVLPGFSAFSASDAHQAALQLLPEGAVRMKKASGVGGCGQRVIRDTAALTTALQSIGEDEWQNHGVVFERNLDQVVTHSVGQIHVDQVTASYCGMQKLTLNNQGEEVYGGSNLTVVRGDFDALLELKLDEATRTAVAQARTYHAAAIAAYPGMITSRCNYDVAQGKDVQGKWYSGVLEQSWRIGGASAAEIAALEAFLSHPGLDVVCTSTTEIYQAHPVLPPDAIVYCQQIDERVGPITKYAQITAYGNPG